MPTFLGLLAGFVAAWIVEDALRPLVGLYGSIVASIVVSYPAYAWTKRYLVDLRDG